MPRIRCPDVEEKVEVMLCDDHHTGQNIDHRKRWLVINMKQLATVSKMQTNSHVLILQIGLSIH